MQRVEVPELGVIEFPDNLSKQEMSAAIQKTLAARQQQTEAAPEKAGRYDLIYPEAVKRQQEQLDAFLISGGRGIADIGQGIKQIALQAGEKIGLADQGRAESYRQQVNDELRNYEELEQIKNNPGTAMLGRIVGGTAATLPVGAAAIPARIAMGMGSRAIATGALQGGLAGGLQYDETGDSRMGNAVLGATLGAAIPGGIVGYKATKNLLTKNPIQMAQDVADQAKKRLQEAKSIDVNLSAGALTRDPTLQAREELFVKGTDSEASAKMRKLYSDVDQQIYNAAQKIVNRLGGEAKTLTEVGADVQGTIRKNYEEGQKIVSDIYEQAKNAPGGNAKIPKKELLESYREVLRDFTDVKLSAGIKNTFRALGEKNTYLNVDQANRLIKSLNQANRTASTESDKLATKLLKQKVYDAIDTIADDAENPASKLYDVARATRTKVGEAFNQKDIVELIRKKKAAFTDYVDPEKVVGSIRTFNDWDKIEKSLKFSVDGKPNPEGEKVWNNLRSSKIADLFKQSTVDVNGELQLGLGKLVNNVKDIKEPVLKKLIGDEKLYKDFQTLVKVMGYWKNKAPGTINYSNSANTINRIAQRGMSTLANIPLIGEGWFLLRKLFQDASDRKWVEENLRISQGKIKPTEKKKVIEEPTFSGNIGRLTVPLMATQPTALPVDEND